MLSIDSAAGFMPTGQAVDASPAVAAGGATRVGYTAYSADTPHQTTTTRSQYRPPAYPATVDPRLPLHADRGSCQNTRFIINIMTTRNRMVMMPPARMKSGTR